MEVLRLECLKFRTLAAMSFHPSLTKSSALFQTMNRVAFGKPLAAQGTIQADVAQSRIEIEQTRLMVLKAAHMMDLYGNKVSYRCRLLIKSAAKLHLNGNTVC